MRLDLLEDICTLSQTEEKTVLLVKLSGSEILHQENYGTVQSCRFTGS